MIPDPIGAISGGIGITQGLVQFLGYVRTLAGSDVVSAYFQWDGKRLSGSDKVNIEKHQGEHEHVWWFSVTGESDYVFVRMPVVESCAHELVGTVKGEKNPDSKFWRWVAQERQGVIVGGQNEPPNLKVDFIVIGYRPKALIKHFSTG